MKIARSLLLSLIFMHGCSQGMLFIPQYIPMMLAATGIVYIKISSYLRDKRLDKIESKIDTIAVDVGQLQKQAEGITGKVDIIQNSLNNQDSILEQQSDQLCEIQLEQEELKCVVTSNHEHLVRDISELRDTANSLAKDILSNHDQIAKKLDDIQAHDEQDAQNIQQIMSRIKEMEQMLETIQSSGQKDRESIESRLQDLSNQCKQILEGFDSRIIKQDNTLSVLCNKLSGMEQTNKQMQDSFDQLAADIRSLSNSRPVYFNQLHGIVTPWQLAALACGIPKKVIKNT